MAVVKGSKQTQMVVVPHMPLRGLLLTLGTLFVAVIFAAGGIRRARCTRRSTAGSTTMVQNTSPARTRASASTSAT